MDAKKTGLVIRTVFNNQGWAGPCKNPLTDQQCYICVKGVLPGINGGNPIEEDAEGYCHGDFGSYAVPEDKWCWEQTLCSEYYWRNIKGKWRYAKVGMPVYFVYSEIDRTLTLWGKAIIDKIDNKHPLPTLHFQKFKPLPQKIWVYGLTGEELTGEHWKQGHYRYLNPRYETYLADLVKGGEKRETKIESNAMLSSGAYEKLDIHLRGDIRNKLGKIAQSEGREVQELIREAVAKLIRERGF